MTYKHCIKIIESGHRCNATFKVGGNYSRQQHCPEHETLTRSTNIKTVLAKEENMRTFVVSQMNEMPKLLDRLNVVEAKVETILTRITNPEFESEYKRMLRGFEDTVKKNRMKDDNFSKLQRQIITLNNRIISLESQFSEEE